VWKDLTKVSGQSLAQTNHCRRKKVIVDSNLEMQPLKRRMGKRA
jgi:hypothetical protein